MSATIALTTAEAEAIARANAALSWIRADTFPWAHARTGEIKACRDELRESLEDYAALTASQVHPATLFPDLEDGRDNAMETALDWVTEDIRKSTAELVTLANEAEETAKAQEGLAA